MIFLIRKVTNKNDAEKTLVKELFKFFKNEKDFEEYKHYEVKNYLNGKDDASIFIDGDNLTVETKDFTKKIILLDKFVSERDGLIYLAEYKGLDSTPFKSLPETIWFN